MKRKVSKFVMVTLGVILSVTLAENVVSAKTMVYQGESVEVDCQEGLRNQVIARIDKLSDKEATQIVLGKNVESIFCGNDGREDFYAYHHYTPDNFSSIVKGFPKLKEICVEEGNIYLTAQDGVLYSNREKELLACPLQKGGTLVIPEGVRCIGKGSVYGNRKITSIKIPSTVDKIYGAAFGGNTSCVKYIVSSKNKKYVAKDGVLFTKDMKRLVSYPAGKKGSSYTIPKEVKTIDYTAFKGAKYLKRVTFSSSVKTVLPSAFLECKKLVKVVCNKNLKTIGEGAFYNCPKLKSFSMKEGLKTIDDNVFGKTKSLKKLVIPCSVSRLSDDGLKNKTIVIYKKGKVYKTWKKQKAFTPLKKKQKLKFVIK